MVLTHSFFMLTTLAASHQPPEHSGKTYLFPSQHLKQEVLGGDVPSWIKVVHDFIDSLMWTNAGVSPGFLH